MHLGVQIAEAPQGVLQERLPQGKQVEEGGQDS